MPLSSPKTQNPFGRVRQRQIPKVYPNHFWNYLAPWRTPRVDNESVCVYAIGIEIFLANIFDHSKRLLRCCCCCCYIHIYEVLVDFHWDKRWHLEATSDGFFLFNFCCILIGGEFNLPNSLTSTVLGLFLAATTKSIATTQSSVSYVPHAAYT